MDIKERTIAERLHDAYRVQMQVEEAISDAFEKYESEIYDKLDFSIGSDDYDNSIEIYIKNVITYPYEPSWEVRDVIYAMGFGIVYWNFVDENGKYTEEIRGAEPRRYKEAKERYDAKWCKDFWDKWGISGTDNRFDGTWFEKYKRK
jgi:hypothetical protein